MRRKDVKNRKISGRERSGSPASERMVPQLDGVVASRKTSAEERERHFWKPETLSLRNAGEARIVTSVRRQNDDVKERDLNDLR